MKFSPDEIINHIHEYERENGVIFSPEEVLGISKTYNLAYNYQESKLNEGEVIDYRTNVSTLDYIMEGRVLAERGARLGNPTLENETFEEMNVHFSDVKHMNYFDNFFRQGETDKIQKVLFQHDVPVDALKGVQPYSDFHNTYGDFTIDQDVYKPPEGSPELLGFTIRNINTGEIIYEYSPSHGVDAAEEIISRKIEYYRKENQFNFFGEPMQVVEQKKKLVKVAETIIDTGDEDIRIEGYTGKRKDGSFYKRIVYKDSKGRFTKKPDMYDEE